MADLLTHVLVPFVLLTTLSWRLEWFQERWVPVAMGGAAIPDLVKIRLVVDDSIVEGLLGLQFSWSPLGTLGGLLVTAAAIAVWFHEERSTAYAWLVAGGISALSLDGMRAFADGQANFWLYPLWWRPPTANLYVSSDYRVTAAVVLLAGAVAVVDRSVANASVRFR